MALVVLTALIPGMAEAMGGKIQQAEYVIVNILLAFKSMRDFNVV